MFRRRKKEGASVRDDTKPAEPVLPPVAVSVPTPASATELVTQELYRKNVELAHTNRTLSLLRSIDELVLEPHITIDELAAGVTNSVVASSTFAMSALFVREHTDDASTPFYLRGYAFVEQKLPLKISHQLTKLRLNPTLSMFSGEEKSEILNVESIDTKLDEQSLGLDADLIGELAAFSRAKSFCIVKLQARRETVGVLLVGMLEATDQVSADERAMLERLSQAIGVAIDNKLLFEENQRVLRKLRLSNNKLKALDQAKDEFISMASHQLRTPLTSVKGYLSMLADGDAGPLTTTQKQFIDQAFLSSQRMVYLIADLLNVSRLKTGKFVVEAKPTYLPDVVETEIAQLREAIKARGLTLLYDKPKKFPTLMLDEIKIRQVIMNFTDNAVYYTPAGGKITVALVEKPKTVEFMVIDTGIGVPPAERHRLFSKFYRAGNARKSRPDGTGLGLFMAKKVIVAQGGAIIFKTQEGKGSTFGFTFAKEKLAVPALDKA